MYIARMWNEIVSVPIRGLFNLTYKKRLTQTQGNAFKSFRPHQGII